MISAESSVGDIVPAGERLRRVRKVFLARVRRESAWSSSTGAPREYRGVLDRRDSYRGVWWGSGAGRRFIHGQQGRMLSGLGSQWGGEDHPAEESFGPVKTPGWLCHSERRGHHATASACRGSTRARSRAGRASHNSGDERRRQPQAGRIRALCRPARPKTTLRLRVISRSSSVEPARCGQLERR